MVKMSVLDGVVVWVNEDRCKGCDICVLVCFVGVFGMGIEKERVFGKVVKVVYLESCIGCV